jgi:hypothetical protein
MARIVQLACDVCERLQGEGEGNWLVAFTWADRPRSITFAPAGSEVGVTGAIVEHICGEACAQVRLSRALTTEVKEQG